MSVSPQRVVVVDPIKRFTVNLIADLERAGCEVTFDDVYKTGGNTASDIVHVDWCDQNAVMASRAPHKRLTIRLHRWELKTRWPALVQWENVDELIFVSGFQKRVFADLFPDARPRCTRVVPAIEHVAELPFKPRVSGGDVIIVSRIEPHKGISLAFQVARRCPERKFHWFGAFEPNDVYMPYYVRQNAPPNLVLRGALPHADLMNLLQYEGFTEMLHCSATEGWPVCVAEAMALGIRPVVHRFPGADDILPASVLWTDIDEAVAMLKTAAGSETLREWIEDQSRVRLSTIVLGHG